MSEDSEKNADCRSFNRSNSARYQRLSEIEEISKRHPSIILPHLQSIEKKFFRLVHLSDVTAVDSFLNENPGFNMNCRNFQGISALLIAIQNRSQSMVKFLLLKNVEIGDCILHAIRDNQVEIMELLLNKQNEIAPSLEPAGVFHSSDFPDYITPLILAAQCGHYEIIHILIERGHEINKPHSPKCRCTDCKTQLERNDLLHLENLRMNLYRAISNPAFICHSSTDPILTSFVLGNELKQCSKLLTEFRSIYIELYNSVSQFAVDLISCCRNSDEIELILTQPISEEDNLTSTFFFKYPRLILAMDYKQKTFISHPNTQHIIENLWNGNWHEYKLKPFLAKISYPIQRIVLLPFITILSLICPKNHLTLHYNIPLNRMINHISSFLIFLLIIFFESNLIKTQQKREPPNSGIEPILILFVFGNVWNVVRMCLIQGPKRYLTSLWNWHSIITNLLFLLTFLLWFASYFDSIHNNDQIDLERKYWHELDPILIAEGTFAIATIMSYFKLMFFCRLNYYVGPLQISLGKMCSDMAKYTLIFTIIILAFSVGLCRFYNYYDGMVQIDSNGIKTAQVSSFIDFSSTLKTFFWALLCMSPLESADVIIENLPGETENTTIINRHNFTEAIGYLAFALFELLTVVMILNMLIATMSSTFQRVIDNLDIEWTFGKTDFYLEYMMQSTLPSPFNLIPTPNGISGFMEWFQSSKSLTDGNTKGKGSKKKSIFFA